MTKGRIAVAALAGGIGMYFWASLAHLALPLATVGVSEITNNETAALDALHTSIGDKPGFYIFPSIGLNAGADAMKMYDAKLASTPSGLLIYHPPGARSLTPGQLLTEFLVELLEAAVAIVLLAQTNITSLGGRIGFVALVGLLAALPTNVSYWNWYGFPTSYTISYMFTEIVGFTVAGIIAAFILRRT